MKPVQRTTRVLRPVAILGGVRTPFVKSFTNYRRTSNQDLMTATLQKLVEKFALQGERLGDVALGAVMKNASDFNLARESVLGTTLDPQTPAYDLQRACATSLEATLHVGLKIGVGQIENGIAAGTDTNSDIVGVFSKDFSWTLLDLQKAKTFPEKMRLLMNIRPHHFIPAFPGVVEPRTGLSMGQHCELMVKEWKISRQEQDELAYQSHIKAAKAYEEGFYKDLVFEFRDLKKDILVRGDTTIEKLSRLKPAFDFSGQGTLTAGNSTALTDGASSVFLSSEEYAQKKGLPVHAYLVDGQAAAVDYVNGEGLLMAPVRAVSELLLRNNLTLQDFDFYEIHEAFSGQALCNLKAWESAEYCRNKLGRSEAMGSIDRSKMNIKGGSVALGHPFAATGTRIVASLAKMLHQKGSGRGLISVCTAGGMGVAAILEK